MMTEEMIHTIERLEEQKAQLLEQRAQFIALVDRLDDRNSLKLQLLKQDMYKILKVNENDRNRKDS